MAQSQVEPIAELGPNPTRKDIIAHWDPENPVFWEKYGKGAANRNLVVSIIALLMSFCVNTLAALVSAQLGNAGFDFSASDLFLLTALPGLIGATGRLVFTYLPAIFGGRNFTFVSTAFMLIPLVGIGMAVQDASTSFGMFCFWFALLGLSLSNFAASMANIGFFFPIAKKGTANGLNAGIGNLGVAVTYFVTPIVIGMNMGIGGAATTPVGTQLFLQNACFVWIVPIVVSLVLVWFFMDNLPMEKQSPAQMLAIFKNKHTWFMTIIYTCGFGSFIGYSMALALIIKAVFPEVDASMMMFLGPLIGAGIRPVGGWLSDKIDSGAKVTFVSLAIMLICTILVIIEIQAHNFALFFIAFLVLFLTTGMINGATFRMVPNIFHDRQQASQVTGFTAGIAAYGAFIIPILFRSDYFTALVVLACFTVVTLALTWVVYTRKNAEVKC
ncbi:MFS transporter [Curtanaerobium respiraculi]|uniref:MFS transporter n=1 Tax=Curtanaerobium respiraculi TaxID=2949669 RepID=UPI0024B332AC|nr:MFS transporter [Curtanaerobium respiraculi]